MTQSTEVAIPERFSYFRTVDSPMGRSVKRKLERITKSHLDIPEDLATAFGRAMNTGDPLGDDYISAAFASPRGKARQQLKLLGYLPTDDDIAAMMHHWRYVGHLRVPRRRGSRRP
jgi:hypothetical protein